MPGGQTPTKSLRQPWWRGSRGEYYVLLRFALFALIIFGLRTFSDSPAWHAPVSGATSVLGALLLAAGAVLVLSGAGRIGTKLSPLPHPRDGARLHVTGPFRFVRHPMCGGAILMAFGWGLWVRGWLTLVYAVALAVLFDLKARREERWPRATYPDYVQYQSRTKKLIPFVY